MIRRFTLSVAAATPLAFVAAALFGSVIAGWFTDVRPPTAPPFGPGEMLLRSQVSTLAELETRARARSAAAAQLETTRQIVVQSLAGDQARCVWEHTELDGRTTTTRLPFPCERPVRSASQRIRTTAYYSPATEQARYATGSLEGDVRLNGQGTRTAAGAVPAHGVLAAPSGYPFGTRMHVEGYGLGTVQDRGGRIVRHGDVDRVDVWMGHGERGLRRAMAWGIRDQIATVFVDGEADDIDRLAGAVLDG